MEKRFFIAVKALICYEDKILLIRRSEETRGDFNKWEFPGGRLEFGESPEQALKREVKEEVGIGIQDLELINAWDFLKDKDIQIVGLTYICRAFDCDVILSKEHTNFKWVLRDQIHQYDLVSGMKEQLEKLDWDYIDLFKSFVNRRD